MFKLFRKKPELQPIDFYDTARAHPGKLIVFPSCILVYLGDVDVMSTTYVDTRKLSGDQCLEVVKSGLATDRHPQIHL